MRGRDLNQLYRVGARHALYSKDGTWYHLLERFPGALFDANKGGYGYVLFKTRQDYENCRYLNITQELNVPAGISSIPGYTRLAKLR